MPSAVCPKCGGVLEVHDLEVEAYYDPTFRGVGYAYWVAKYNGWCPACDWPYPGQQASGPLCAHADGRTPASLLPYPAEQAGPYVYIDPAYQPQTFTITSLNNLTKEEWTIYEDGKLRLRKKLGVDTDPSEGKP